MSTFYVLPSRPVLGQRFTEFLGNALPGLRWPRSDWSDIAETLTAATVTQPDVFVVFQEDVPETMTLESALRTDFGAEPGDHVIEVSLGSRWSDWTVRRWQVGGDIRRVA